MHQIRLSNVVLTTRFCQKLLWPWLAVFVGGCGSSGPVIRDTLDPKTGITITHVDLPIVFYRDRSSRAAEARDFVYLGPLRINRMGHHRYFLWLAAWTTSHDEHLANEQDGLRSIVVFADGEPLEFTRAGWTAAAIGASESVYAKPFASATEAYYEVTLDQLRLLAGATLIRLQSTGPHGRAYEPWDSHASSHSSIQAFLEYVGE